MDPVDLALILVIIGIVLIIVEALSPGVYMIIPGTVLLILGLIGWAFPDFLMTWKSPLVALIVAVPITILTVWGYRYLGRPEPPSTTVMDSLIGRTGKVTVAITPGSMKGKVRIGSDVWSAEADDEIPVGEEIMVDSSSGVHVHVKKK